MNNITSIIKETEYVIVDIETTGFSVEFCHIIEIAAIKIRNGEIVDTFQTYVRQNEPIPPFITCLTGISDFDVMGGKSISIAIREFDVFVNDLAIVGHNVAFDYRFLNHDSEKYINRSISSERIDTVRLAKEQISDIINFKLSSLVDYFQITDLGQHSALNDVYMTYELIKCLSDLHDNYRARTVNQISRVDHCCCHFLNKRITIKTKLEHVQVRLLECIFTDMNSKVYYSLYDSCNVLLLNENTYIRFCSVEIFDEVWEPWLAIAKQRYREGTLAVYSEKMACELLGIPIVDRKKPKWGEHVLVKDLDASIVEPDENHTLYRKNCVFTGALDKYDRKKAMQLVINVGGVCQNGITKDTDYLILGDNSFCASIKGGKSSKQLKVEKMMMDGSGVKIISESTFYEILKNE